MEIRKQANDSRRILSCTVGEDDTIRLVTAVDYTQSPDKQKLTEADVVGRVVAVLPQFGAIQPSCSIRCLALC